MVSAAAASCDIVLPQGAQCATLRQPEQGAPSSPARTPIHVSACTAMAEAAEGDPAFSMQINLSFEAAARAGARVAQPASNLTSHFAAVENLLFEGNLACSGGQQQGLSPSPTPSPSPSPSSRPPPAVSPLNPELLLDAVSLKVMESSRHNQSLVGSPHAEEWLVGHSAVDHSVALAPEPAADSEPLPSRGTGGEEPGLDSVPWSQWLSPLAPVTGAAAAVVVHVDAVDCATAEPGAQAPDGTTSLPRTEVAPCAVRRPAHTCDAEGAGAGERAAQADRVPGPCPAPEPCAPHARADPASGPSPAEPRHGPYHAGQPLPVTEHADPLPRHNPAAAPPEPCSEASRPQHAAASPSVREAYTLYEPRAEDPAGGVPLSLAPGQRVSPWPPAQRADVLAPGNPAARVAAAPRPTGRTGPWPPAAYAGGGSLRGPQAGQPRLQLQPPVAPAQRAHMPSAAAGRGPLPAPWPRQEDFAIRALRARGGAAREGGAGGVAAAVPERAPAMKRPLALATRDETKRVQPAAMRVGPRPPDHPSFCSPKTLA